MTAEQQPQDHPGPDWWETSRTSSDGSRGGSFTHPCLQTVVHWAEPSTTSMTKAEAVARCRAISAAALAWEKMKLAATEPERKRQLADMGDQLEKIVPALKMLKELVQ